jgi:hypothetical protein
MRVERGLEGRDQLLKLFKGQARQIQELRGARLHVGEPYTGHPWCLLSWEAQYAIIGINSYLLLGVISERAFEDGRVIRQRRSDAAGVWYLTFQEKLPRLTLIETVEVDPSSVETVDNERMDLHYAFVHRFTFERPAYLRVLALLLVLLVTAAAGFAVFLRPLHELVLSAGGLILGVWGVRSIISPSSQAFVSAIDLSLALVILFLLGAITVRALVFLVAQARSATPPVE